MKPEENAVAPLAGGIMQHGYQCGMIWGASLAAGAEAYRLFGPGPQAHAAAVIAAGKIVESFRANHKHINCLEITEIDKSSTTMEMITFFLIKGGTIGCIRMAAKYARTAFNEIGTALSDKDLESPPAPVSCAAVLADKMGMSELQITMAAGLAGGIGLCGGACGALGAAIWILGVKKLNEGTGKVGFGDPEARNLIEKFLKCTDCKFECSEIVGRKFESVEDHAGYVRDGGCMSIIESLTSV